MKKYFHSLEEDLKPPPPSKGVALLEEIIAAKREWERLDAEIAKHLNFCLEKFMWGLGNAPKFLPADVLSIKTGHFARSHDV